MEEKKGSVTDREVVYKLLRENRRIRNSSDRSAGELYRLGTKGPILRYDGSVPIIGGKRPNNDDEKDPPMNMKRFLERGFRPAKSCSCLENFPLMRDGKGFVIAGGIVAAILSDRAWGPNAAAQHDIDLFLVGCTEEEALEEIRRLAEHLQRTVNEIAEHLQGAVNKLSVARTATTITFFAERYHPSIRFAPVQVILRLYESVSEVLHGFDLGSAAAAYDGKDVWMTKLGLFAHENHLNVIDLTCRWPSYERRLKKYIDRGFGLVLPEMSQKHLDAVAGEGIGEILLGKSLYLSVRADQTVLYAELTDASGAIIESDYQAFKIYWDDAHHMLRRNCTAAWHEPVLTGALCAKSGYVSEMDLTAIPVSFAELPKYLDKVLNNKTKIQEVAKVLGVEATQQVLLATTAGEELDLQAITQMVETQLAPRAVIPFTLRKEGSLPAPRAAIEWYGSSYLPGGSGIVYPTLCNMLSVPGAAVVVCPHVLIKLICAFACTDFCIDGACSNDCPLCSFHMHVAEAAMKMATERAEAAAAAKKKEAVEGEEAAEEEATAAEEEEATAEEEIVAL